MDRVFTSGAAASPSSGYPTAGNPAGGIPATTPGPWWYHMVTEELCAVVSAAGLTPDHANLTQLSAAISALTSNAAAVGIQGTFKNLQASATGLSANVLVSADEIVLESAGNAYKTVRGVNLTIAGTSSGVANGLDTGALAINTWYSVWVINNGSTTAGLLSLSATAPTLPSGYTHKARVGWIRTDGTANKYPLSFIQAGRRVQYKVAAGSNVPSAPQMASGIAGSISVPTWVSIATASFVPPTAVKIDVLLSVAGGATIAMVAPNNAFGPNTSNTNQAPGVSNGAGYEYGRMAQFLLEAAAIYWASSGVTNGLFCHGWEDNI